jgi:6,7-dimethyl-8-ribityllumazine synthase
MIEILTGDLTVHPAHHFALVVAEFNSFITRRLAEGAVECLLRHGAKESQIVEVRVPGCFEIPTVAAQLARSAEGGAKYAAIICLGCVIRGQTAHFDHVAGQASRGIGMIGPETGVPTIFGVITSDTVEQALDRAGLKSGNAGWNAAMAALSMASIMTKIHNEKPKPNK